MKRRFFIISFFCLLLLPAILSLLCLKIQEVVVKYEVKEHLISKLEKEELTLVAIHKEQQSLLSWEHAKEFEFQGEMYDVVFKENSSDSIFYWCWWDKTETKLNNKIKLLTQTLLGDQNAQTKHDLLAVWFYSAIYFEPSTIFSFNFLFTPEEFFCRFYNYYNSLIIVIDNPPPDNIT